MSKVSQASGAGAQEQGSQGKAAGEEIRDLMGAWEGDTLGPCMDVDFHSERSGRPWRV